MLQNMVYQLLYFVIELYFIISSHTAFSRTPNFIVFLTDDQDIFLNGLIPMSKTRFKIGKQGAEFVNMFVTTPLCCPSRASILTGKYAHNHGIRNNSISGNCNSLLWQKYHENNAFITHFKRAGYTTFYAGKYLNQYGTDGTGGVGHVPFGWDYWFGLVGNSVYYNYSLSVNGKKVNYGSDPEKDYLTDVITKEALNFLYHQNESAPFFIFLSPPAPHAPFTSLPKFKYKFSNLSAPRTPNFGVHSGKNKHWLLRQPPKTLPEYVIKSIDDVFRNRWRTLLSVDDSIDRILLQLEKTGFLNNTYIFVTSDNGFHLGQFSLPWDKRQLYEFDIRVPLLVRGPGINSGIKINHPVLNIDLAPTFLDLAKLPIPPEFDGKSFVSSLKSLKTRLSNRSYFIVEHQGESTSKAVPECPQYKAREVHTCEIDCICEDSRNNSYICIRQLSTTENLITCIFRDDERYREAYNISEDPYQLDNLFSISEKANDLLTNLKHKFFN